MIKIKYSLNEGIADYRGIQVKENYNTNPRNLIKACRECLETEKSHNQAYGSMGAGGVWIEIDGQRLDDFVSPEFLLEELRYQNGINYAKEILEEIKSGIKV